MWHNTWNRGGRSKLILYLIHIILYIYYIFYINELKKKMLCHIPCQEWLCRATKLMWHNYFLVSLMSHFEDYMARNMMWHKKVCIIPYVTYRNWYTTLFKKVMGGSNLKKHSPDRFVFDEGYQWFFYFLYPYHCDRVYPPTHSKEIYMNIIYYIICQWIRT
jgi:hypothetical protein